MTADSQTRLEPFLDAVRRTNPFAACRADDPSVLAVDVESFRAAEFDRLTALARQAHENNQGLGVVLDGEAGTGKSHLLARFERWANQEDRACFLYLPNLRAAAERLPRSVLHSVFTTLTGGREQRFHDTPLYFLIRAAIQEAKRQEGTSTRSQRELQALFHRLIDRLIAEDAARARLLDRTVFRILLGFYLSANVAHHYPDQDDLVATLAARWLTGDPLDPLDAELLAFPPDGSSEALTMPDSMVVKALAAVAQLNRYGRRPLVLVFDHVDGLDSDQASALADLIHTLVAGTGNVLVVCAGVGAAWQRFRDDSALPAEVWDHVAGTQIILGRIDRRDGRQLLEARLRQFLAPFAGMAEVRERCRLDSLFPLGRSWFDHRLRNLSVFRPRDLLRWAADRWRQQQESLAQLSDVDWLAQWPGPVDRERRSATTDAKQLTAAIDQLVGQALADQFALRQRLPQRLPPCGHHLAGLIHTLLLQCLNKRGYYPLASVEPPLPDEGPQPPFDLRLRRRDDTQGDWETRAGVVFLVTTSPAAAAARLRGPVAQDEGLDEVILVTDERRPLPVIAEPDAEGRRHLEALRQRGPSRFWHLELTFDQYAELDAMQAIVALARAGDLAVELPDGELRPVNEAEVIASHHRKGRYLAQPVLRLLLAGAEWPPVRNARPALDEADVRQFVLTQLGKMSRASIQELAARYVAHVQLSRQVQLDAAACRPRLEEVVRKLQHDGLVSAANGADGLYLLARRE